MDYKAINSERWQKARDEGDLKTAWHLQAEELLYNFSMIYNTYIHRMKIIIHRMK